MEKKGLELIFLGSSGAIQVPSFHCSCKSCEEARRNPKLRRTRASAVLLGSETILIDASPDMEFQLEREKIRSIDRIFITHWHYDHCFGLAAFPELGSHGTWEKKVIDLYLPEQDIGFFDRDFAWAKSRFNLHPVTPGDVIDLPDATFEIVKTTHSVDSVGYIISSPNTTFSYLVDGVIPPEETLKHLKQKKIDLLILEGTLDELFLPKGVEWQNFAVYEAISFWKSLDVPKLILTHLSCHRWNMNKLIAGFTSNEREAIEKETPGLKFAYDGLKMKV
jgi:phosphoribosyl 1,2-cyclic phosphate phosphodiesterase